MNAIGMVLKMEQEAIDFYLTCAAKTNNPVGRKMFQSIAEDERYHLACALNMQKGQKVLPAKAAPLEDRKKIFEEHKEEVLRQVPATAGDLEALTVAMKMEKDTVSFYAKSAAEAISAEEKNLFECLINDEKEHFHIFQNTYSFLSDPSNWYMQEEQGIVEG